MRCLATFRKLHLEKRGSNCSKELPQSCIRQVFLRLMSGKTVKETHLFFSCNKIMPLWWDFTSWVNEARVMHCRPVDHFTQHLSLAASQAINRKWKVWWVAATVSIWNYRNSMIFKNHQFVISNLVDDAIYLTWSWLRGWEKDFAIPFNQWSSSIVEVRLELRSINSSSNLRLCA
ncbi:hypothetical protein GmHk_10G029165 [Glycine max]|nr:hypothetical protein GmHk_10G029165 [Glycine max]